MSLYSKISLFFLFFIPIPFGLRSQPCALNLSGRVTVKGTGVALSSATVYIESEKKGSATDSAGFFRIRNLCRGNYLLKVSHLGCEPQWMPLQLTKDTVLFFSLNHFNAFLNEIEVHGKNGNNSTQISHTISREEIVGKSNTNLADILENIQGVRALHNGSAISKPIIHGLYGNRIAILNNGILQSGQQWGNDHAPEIDPFMADHLAVVKGTAALQYSGSSLGGVVLADTKNIENNTVLRGNVNYILQTNGLGNTINAQLEKGTKWGAWRFSGTLKRIGDGKTPDYFLTNTGKRESNGAIQFEKKISKHWNTELYYSLFDTEIGILRGSHIGNTTDLAEAMTRDTPFFTKNSFSYQIESPSQKVIHHLLKLKTIFRKNENSFFDITYGGQINHRKEFDVRRSGRSDIPALSLSLNSHSLLLTWFTKFLNNSVIKTGISGNFTDNTNNPETGILPLIPDYQMIHSSTFILFQKNFHKLFYEFGGRYDVRFLDVWGISKNLPRKIEFTDHEFNDFSFSAGSRYPVTDFFSVTANAGFTSRSPEINELYSFGLHQGVSGIEEGDPALTSEKSVKLIVNTDWNISGRLNFQMLNYYQQISDFIYLQPQQEFRLTLRGAFPVFVYKQADSQIYGTDFILSYEPFHRLRFTSQYAFVKGRNLEENIPLINIPAPLISANLIFFPADFLKFAQNEISVTGKYNFKQKNILAYQDFLLPPDGYFLVSSEASTKMEINNSMLKISIFANNLLNTSYRDYLNRLRYFADEPGFSFRIGLNYSF